MRLEPTWVCLTWIHFYCRYLVSIPDHKTMQPRYRLLSVPGWSTMQLKSGDKTNLHPHISGDVTCTSRQVAIIIVFTRLWKTMQPRTDCFQFLDVIHEVPVEVGDKNTSTLVEMWHVQADKWLLSLLDCGWTKQYYMYLTHTQSTNVLRSGFTLGLGLAAQDQVKSVPHIQISLFPTWGDTF